MLQRLVDVVLALFVLTAALPVLVVAAVAIVVESGRPVFFVQTRVGRHGRPFRLFKLRSLAREPSDPSNPAGHATRVGRVLRRYAIDELPQLGNVLRGDMSLVGPRPTVPRHVAQYGPYERRRLDVRPGLTGWAQIHGRNALSWPERIDLDVWYVEHRSLGLDLRILARTPGVLWRGTGVYGTEGVNPSFSPSSPSPHE